MINIHEDLKTHPHEPGLAEPRLRIPAGRSALAGERIYRRTIRELQRNQIGQARRASFEATEGGEVFPPRLIAPDDRRLMGASTVPQATFCYIRPMAAGVFGTPLPSLKIPLRNYRDVSI